MNQAVYVDLETTGFQANRHEIVELAAALFTYNPENGKILKVIDYYAGTREPTMGIPKNASKIHGLTIEDVKGTRLDDFKIIELIDKAEFIVSHNAKFDYPFLLDYLPDIKGHPWHCSMEQVSWRNQSRSLSSLLKLHNINNSNSHRALSDVQASLKLLSKMRENGKTYFYDIINSPKLSDFELEKAKPKQKASAVGIQQYETKGEHNIAVWPYAILLFVLMLAGALTFGFRGVLAGIGATIVASIISVVIKK